MAQRNLLVIMDDEHSPKALGCYGHPLVKTPHLDRMAERGTRFQWAYTNSPICVPARAVFATGQYTHKTGYWDNCQAYDGRVKSWGHRLQAENIPVRSIGKLHYVDEASPTGFDEQTIPMHIHQGGDTMGLVRDNPPRRDQCRDLAENIGPGHTKYIDYDRQITANTCSWLESQADSGTDKPWVTFVSYICPHYPMVCPPEFYELYDPEKIPLPKARTDKNSGPAEWWQAFENCYTWDQYFENDAQRRIAIAAYFGLCSFIDDNVGQIFKTLDQTGLAATTNVVFLSDHGENLGARGLWGKSTLYEESAGIPLIMAGPDVPANVVKQTPVSLIDMYPSILESVGLAPDKEEAALPGRSLFKVIEEDDEPDRLVFSEYHATASKSAEYMIRKGRYKYIHYVGYDPELYDLRNDPEELDNLATDPAYKDLLEEFETDLRSILDPEKTDLAAKADQAKLIEQYGGAKALIDRGGRSATPAPV